MMTAIELLNLIYPVVKHNKQQTLDPNKLHLKKKKLMANGNHQEDQNSAEDKTFRKIPRITVG
jgi:hypothetical protein